MFTGYEMEHWLEPGKQITRASGLKNEGSLCVFLGAGNFEGPNEILQKLFVENCVGIYKPNPVNQVVMIEILPKLMAPLFEVFFLFRFFETKKRAQSTRLINLHRMDSWI